MNPSDDLSRYPQSDRNDDLEELSHRALQDAFPVEGIQAFLQKRRPAWTGE